MGKINEYTPHSLKEEINELLNEKSNIYDSVKDFSKADSTRTTIAISRMQSINTKVKNLFAKLKKMEPSVRLGAFEIKEVEA